MKAPGAREDNAPRLMLAAEVVRLVVPRDNRLFVIHTVVPAFDG